MDFDALNLLFRFSKENSHEKIRMKGLSDTEYMICTYVYSHENCTQDDVSTGLRIDKTTVGKALFSLEKKKCIERFKDSVDKRKKHLKITEHGYERIRDLMNVHNDWLTEVLACLSSEEKEQFEMLCKKILISAEAFSKKRLLD